MIDNREGLGIEGRVLEEYCSAGTEDIFLIGDEEVGLLVLRKAGQAVIVDHCLSQHHQKLLHIVSEVPHLQTRSSRIAISLLHVYNEESFYAAEHASHVSEMAL